VLAEYVLAMKHKLGLNKVLGTIHTYPTMSEANKYVAGEWKRAHQPHALLAWVEKFHLARGRLMAARATLSSCGHGAAAALLCAAHPASAQAVQAPQTAQTLRTPAAAQPVPIAAFSSAAGGRTTCALARHQPACGQSAAQPVRHHRARRPPRAAAAQRQVLQHPQPHHHPGQRHLPGLLRWRWRLDVPLARSDLRRKDGDDVALKVCALFDQPLSTLPFGERALLQLARAVTGENLPSATLCYVWDTSLPTGTVLPNAYTQRVRYLVVDSGALTPGPWSRHQRDLGTDFRAGLRHALGYHTALGRHRRRHRCRQHRRKQPGLPRRHHPASCTLMPDTTSAPQAAPTPAVQRVARAAASPGYLPRQLVLVGASWRMCMCSPSWPTSRWWARASPWLPPTPMRLPSDLLPGYVAGHHSLQDLLDSPGALGLAAPAFAGLRAACSSWTPHTCKLHLDDGTSMEYNWLSVNSDAVHFTRSSLAAVARCTGTRPVAAANGPLCGAMGQGGGTGPADGAAYRGGGRWHLGVALALAVRHRLPKASVTLLTGGGPLASACAPAVRARLWGHLRARAG